MDRFTWGIVIGSLLLVLVGIGTVVWVQDRSLPPPDLSRPEGVVRAYVEAVQTGNAERAWELLSESAREGITRQEFVQRITVERRPQEGRVAIESVQIDGNTAIVELSRTYATGGGPFGLFGPTSYTDRQRVRLEQQRGIWLITVPPDPYLVNQRPVPAIIVTPVAPTPGPTATAGGSRP
jgi:hypothetical protein